METAISKFKKLDTQLDARICNKKTVPFGEEGASDVAKHKAKERTERHVDRHKKNDWTEPGVKTAGWMSKHVLWNPPTLQASVADVNKKFEC